MSKSDQAFVAAMKKRIAVRSSSLAGSGSDELQSGFGAPKASAPTFANAVAMSSKDKVVAFQVDVVDTSVTACV